MRFSIIVPVFNIEQYISKCIESVLCQTYKNYELIIVDDGSTDKSYDICLCYKNNKKVTIIHKNNNGLVSARIAGATIAKGEYIICLDGDDWIENNYLREINKIIEKHNIDIVCCGHKEYKDGFFYKKLLSIEPGYYSKKDIIKKIYPHLIYNNKTVGNNLWAKAFKKELYVGEQTLINNDISIGEDLTCVVPCVYKAESVYVCNNTDYVYRINKKSLTKKRRELNINEPELIVGNISNRIDITNSNFQEQISNYLVHSFFNRAYTLFYSNNNYKEIVSVLLKKINSKTYQNALEKSKYKSINRKIMRIIVKRKKIYILYLYSIFKKYK